MDHSHDDGHFRFLLLVSLLLFFVCVQIYVLFKWYYVGYCYYNVSLKGDKYFALDNVYPHIFWVQDEWRCIKRDFSDTGVHQTGSSGSLCFQGTSGVLSVVLTRLFTMYLLLFVKLHFSINNVFVHFMITVIFSSSWWLHKWFMYNCYHCDHIYLYLCKVLFSQYWSSLLQPLDVRS